MASRVNIHIITDISNSNCWYQ